MMNRGPGAGRPPARGFGGGPGGIGGMLPPQKTKNVRRTVGLLLARLRPERGWITISAVLAVGSVAFTVIGPKIVGNATNVIFDGIIGKLLPAGVTKAQAVAGLRARGQNQIADLVSGSNVLPGHGIDFTKLGDILALAALVYVLSALLGWMLAYIMAGVAQRTVFRMRRDVDAKLARLPLKYFDSHPHGDLLSRVTNDIDNITTTLQQSMSQILTSVLTIIGVLGIMLWISWLLALVALVTVPLSIVVTLLVARQSQKQFAAQWARTGDLNGHVEQMHTGHALVQVFGRRQQAIDEFGRQNQSLYEASFRAQFLSGIIQPAMMFLGNLNYVVIAAVGGYRVVTGAMTLGDVQAFIQYSRQFTMPIMQLAGQLNLLQSGLASAERVFEFLAADEEAPDRAATSVQPKDGSVTLEHVFFQYEPEKPLITDFDLEVKPGQMIAIVGPTGAGKTTIVNLLMRFYEIDAGRICLDGVDARDLRREDVRHVFGMVLQDTWLFAGTIRDNIAYGKTGASDAEIVEAAQAAHVDQFVRTLPDGYQTLLTDEASNISAGQKQLVTIARAFLADPAILILDEATSSVDTRTEVLIQEAMARLRRGRTSFVIAHRLSTIRNADSIVVMDQGRIVEQGSHAELLARHGFYYALYNSQFTDALAEAS
ncbi:MAG: ABC transporter ATP-binding protein [Chloroflexi bacterium]|nr:MAG: ABC transporter ATP-binding protein [Chloroflexota bacterium]TME45076.1 MAG: ABC transporter ATP-binding protein [Chloroflexota bacterium]